MPHSQPLVLILAPSGSGAPNSGTQHGPQAIVAHADWPQFKLLFESVHFVKTKFSQSILPVRATLAVAQFNKVLKQRVLQVLRTQAMPLLIGGDHSMAIGTWSAVSQHLGDADLGLIWVDAHMDAHTRSTSVSQSIHGMPVAILLGEGETPLLALSKKRPVIKPQHLIIMGPRSFEAGEAARLKRLGVRVYFDAEMTERGFEVCWKEALQQLEKSCTKIGLSIDLDAFDPKLVPGVGSKAAHGLNPEDAKKAFTGFLHHPQCAAVEIAEFNPYQDKEDRTFHFIHEIILRLNDEKS